MSPLAIGLLLAGSLVVLALAAYAFALWRRVWARQHQHDLAEQQRRERLGADLRIIAGSLLAEQLPLIEGAIRIKVLLDNYDSALSQDPRCRVFHQLFEATALVPTHAAWKALERTERRQHEAHFIALELQHKAAVRSAARWLLEQGLTQPAARR